MNGLKHIEEHGYKVLYIWITDFKRFTLDLEESERTGNTTPNLFDYMNVKKDYPREDKGNDKGGRRKLYHLGRDWQTTLDCI